MSDEQNRQLAQALLDLGILDPHDLAAVLHIEGGLTRLEDAVALAAGMRQKLGSLLCAAQRISPQQLDEALAEQHKSGEKLGEILVATGQISRSQLDAALERQRRSGRKLGEELLAAGDVDAGQLAAGLRLQDGWVTAALVAALSLASGHSMDVQAAGSMAQTIMVSARVAPWVKLHHEHQPLSMSLHAR